MLVLSPTRLLALIALVFLSVACSNVEPSDFYEVEGLVSGELNDTSYARGWDLSHHINSLGLTVDSDQVDSEGIGPLTFSVYISNPGRYAFWVLAAPDTGKKDTSRIDIQITAPDGFLISTAHIELPAGVYLRWHQAESETGDTLINFEQPGRYNISLRPRQNYSVDVHKIQMSAKNARKPFGLGYPSSIRTDLTAADLFREQPVMLPPAWLFEPILGITSTPTDSNEIESIANLFSETPGGIWIPGRSASRVDSAISDKLATGIQMHLFEECAAESEAMYEKGFRFIMSEFTQDISCIKSTHEAYQNVFGPERRPVMFHGIKNMYLPEMKQYPAPITPTYAFAWSMEADIVNGKFRPGGYQELVRDLTDPAGSLYGTPFLSMPVEFSFDHKSLNERDSDLFLRFMQLAPFMPVMHLTLPYPESIDDVSLTDFFTTAEFEAINESIALRKQLFPFHYTHAHYTRQTNESVVTGYHDHSNQYLYGESFLIAPVIEPGANGRLIYFPDGRLWYDYYSGETYEAGRSWFVETSRDKLPLFVKAGSVIPYKTDESDEHLTVEIYTGDAGAFRLVQDDKQSRGYRDTQAARTMFRYNEIEGRYKLTIGAVQAGYEGMPENRNYELHFKYLKSPQSVEINGEIVELTTLENGEGTYSWYYDEDEETLIVKIHSISKDLKQDIVIIP